MEKSRRLREQLADGLRINKRLAGDCAAAQRDLGATRALTAELLSKLRDQIDRAPAGTSMSRVASA